MLSDGLLPCPFCGSTELQWHCNQIGETFETHIECSSGKGGYGGSDCFDLPGAIRQVEQKG